MYKQLLHATLLGALLGTMTPAVAQNPASQPEFQLPTVMGPVMRPQNSSSSTMQLVTMPSGTVENLYIHSWDVFSSPNNSGIAWRRVDASSGFAIEDYVLIPYAEDIDAVIYEDGGQFYVLAGYYYNDVFGGVTEHRYDVYRFDPGVLTLLSTTTLSSSPAFGRINVDATMYGVAITWCEPGVGIFAQASTFPFSGFTSGPVLLPGTAGEVHPDVCIRRGGGGSWTGLDLQLATLDNSLTTLFEHRVPFFNVEAGSSAGFTTEYATTSTGGRYAPPRIECPDIWGNGQRWTVTMGWNDYSGGTVTEWVDAVVMNEDFSPVPTLVTVSALGYSAPGWAEPCDPVVTYNRDADVVTIGWISQQPTGILPSPSDKKYLATDIRDDGTTFPAILPWTFNMISNNPGGNEATLAFSGQNLNSDFDGLHTAFSQFHPAFPNYCMKYKSRPFGMMTFKDNAKLGQAAKDITISPNPFSNAVSFTVPVAGNYTISLTSMDGRVVYTHSEILTQGQSFKVGTQELAAGTYMMNIRSIENNVNKIEKLVKQ